MSQRDFDCLVIHTREGWRQGHSASVSVVSMDESEWLILSSKERVPLPADAISRPLGSRLDETGTPWISGQEDFRLEALENPFWAGIAFDRRNNLHLIEGKTCRIFRYCRQRATLEQVMYIGRCGSQAGRFRFVSSDKDEYGGRMAFGQSSLYVADTFNHRVQAFYQPGFQLRFILGGGQDPGPAAFKSPAVALCRPTDISVSSMGMVYVLDAGNGRVLMMNRHGMLIKIIGAGGACSDALQDPISMALDHDGFLYVLDATKYTIVKFDECANRCDEVVCLHTADTQFRPVTMAVGRDKTLYVGGKSPCPTSRIHQFDGTTGSYLGYFEIEDDCNQLTTDRDGMLYGICGRGRKIIRFGGQRHFARRGTYFSKVLDSTIEKCQWHRLLIDAKIPEKTQVRINFYVSDQPFDPRELDANEWHTVLNSPQGTIATRDALFDEAMGQYLALKFVLAGDGNQSPQIKKFQVYFQRDSFLRYLPATYQEDDRGRDFMERFLSIFESMSLEIEDTIAHVTRYLDIDATETAFLDWLGSWIGVVGDENWSEEKRRTFLKEAFELYKHRGTWKGLNRIIEILTGREARLVEHFRLRPPMVLGQASILGINTFVASKPTKRLILGASSTIGEFVLTDVEDPPEAPFMHDAHDFTVLVETPPGFDDSQKSTLRRLIEQEKPAHTRYFLRITQGRGSQLGKHSLLNIDTVLTNGFRPTRLGENSRVGETAFLGKKYTLKGILGIRSQIAEDANLH